MRIFRSLFIIVISFTIIVSCKRSPQHTDSALLIEQYFDSLSAKNMFCGTVVFKEGDKIKSGRAYGIANLELNTPFTLETHMEIASVSKQFTAVAIMMLYNDRRIDIDSPVNNYLPVTIPFEDITIRHLLTHTSGLPHYEDYFYKKWPEDKYCYNKDILDYYHGLDTYPIFAPGTAFEYNNGGYILLAEIVDHVSGLSLDKFLDMYICKPFGMLSTGFVDRSGMITDSKFAPGYMYDSVSNKYILADSAKGKEYYSFLSKRLGPGRLTTTVLDLSIWDSLLSTNALLPYDMIHEMITPYKLNNDSLTTNYAFGWHVSHDTDTGWHCFHSGSWAGNKAYISRFFQSIHCEAGLSPVQNGNDRDNQNNTTEMIPDNSVIIFSNTNSSYTSIIYNYVDSIIIKHRKEMLNR